MYRCLLWDTTCLNRGDLHPEDTLLRLDIIFPCRDSSLIRVSSLMNGGTFDRVTFTAGVARGRTDTNVSFTWIPVATTMLAFSTLSRKITTALFILAADFTLLCPTSPPTARLHSSTEHGKAGAILMPCLRVSFVRSMVPRAPARGRLQPHTHTHTHTRTCHLNTASVRPVTPQTL